MTNPRDVEYMARALRLAEQGKYTTRPNPNVGCVIVNKHGEVVGSGYHVKAGAPHAEIHALREAGAEAIGGCAFVTLEPCCHEGKTGPCTQAIIEAKLSRVVIAMRDPNPLVAGKGIQALQAQGIEVIDNVLSEQAEKLNRGFNMRMTQGRPWVTVKTATSMDGRTSLRNGHSKWITSENARLDVQKLRASNDAILTGIGTVIADDPMLTMRLNKEQLGVDVDPLQPTRIIIDPELKISPNAKLLHLKGKTVLITQESESNDKINANENCEIIHLPTHEGKFDLRLVMSKLAELEINSVLVEAGSSLMGHLIDSQVVDEIIHYLSPKLMGNPSRGMFDINEIKEMNHCISLECSDIRKIGNDLRITSLITY